MRERKGNETATITNTRCAGNQTEFERLVHALGAASVHDMTPL